MTRKMVELQEDRQIAKDRMAGFQDRMMGYYDSWYKTNRKDGGKAYDEGVAKAKEDPNCCESCITI